MKKRKIRKMVKISLSQTLIGLNWLFIFILIGCKNDKHSNNSSNSVQDEKKWTGIGCGNIAPKNGNIMLCSEVDSNTYIIVGLKNEKTLIDNGVFDIQPDSEDAIKVELIDFNTKVRKFQKLGNITIGYIFPCSDISSNRYKPDTLQHIEGLIRIESQGISPQNERRYLITIPNASFILDNKKKELENYQGKVRFEKGFPG